MRIINDRYLLHEVIAAGGTATIHLGRLLGAAGFARTVAIKRLHPHLATDVEFVSMLLDEARIAARIRHPNVVATLDTVAADGELLVVMEFVRGESLSRIERRLRRGGERVPVDIAVSICVGALHGLHAAHEAIGEQGEHLGVVHRDVSPQNILVGADGLTRVLDFGVAKALGRYQTTQQGQLKGKTAYMAPEQIRGLQLDRRTDVYAAAVVLWEMFTGRRLFVGESPSETMTHVLEQPIGRPSDIVPSLPKQLDDIVMRGLERDPNKRFATAEEMALALEAVGCVPNLGAVSRWVNGLMATELTKQSAMLFQLEGLPLADVERTLVQPMLFRLEGLPLERTLVQPILFPGGDAQFSSVSVPPAASNDALPRKRSPLSTVPIAVAVILALATAAVTLRVLRDGRGAVTPASSSRLDTSGSQPTVSAPLTEEPPIPAAGSAVPVAAPTPSTVGTQAPKRPRLPQKASSKPRCSPPYTVDSDGVHVPKKECL